MRKSTVKALKLIQEKYGRIEVDGEMVPDPNIVWVGPFLDGLLHLNIFSDLHRAKSFFFEVNEPDKHGFELKFYRVKGKKPVTSEWPYEDVKYSKPLILRRISGKEGDSIEPGEIINSATSVPVDADDIWQTEPDIMDWDVQIREDKKHGLHIFNRGDKFVKTFYFPLLKEVITEEFVLRPPGEGTSKLPMVGITPEGEIL